VAAKIEKINKVFILKMAEIYCMIMEKMYEDAIIGDIILKFYNL